MECLHLSNAGTRLLHLLDQSLGGHADVLGYLTEENRGDVSTWVEWNCGGPAVGMPKLLVGTTLADFDETQSLKNSYNLTRLENRESSHAHFTRTF